jgi:predicted RNA methylase
VRVERLARALREGRRVHDADYDELLPNHLQRVSCGFFSPVAVARRAATLLSASGATRVLDIGAGVGKFCVVGACSTPASFVGVEQRRSLVDAARHMIDALGVDRVEMRHGTLDVVAGEAFDGFYLFNPFAENFLADDRCIDESVELSRTRFVRDVSEARELLRAAPRGATAVTYYGLGAPMPSEYRLTHAEFIGGGELCVWVQAAGDELTTSRLPERREGSLETTK